MVYELEKEHKKSSLMCKKKEELVKEIMRLEHNVNVMNERLNVQADAIEHYEQESRNKAIDEFAERMKRKWIDAWDLNLFSSFREFVDEIAEQMKGGAT